MSATTQLIDGLLAALMIGGVALSVLVLSLVFVAIREVARDARHRALREHG